MDIKYNSVKENSLYEWLNKTKKLVVAYSGGVDSSLLSVVAHEVLCENMIAVTIDSPFMSKRDLKEAITLARKFGIKHEIIREDIDEVVLKNPKNRCYYCKIDEYLKIKKFAHSVGIELILDGMNLDDQVDYRPGALAAQELGVRSPLQELGYTKNEIRAFAKKLGLENWDKPANACLASRVVSEEYITLEKLSRIEDAEDFIRDLGFRNVRVRNHGDLARIEIEKNEMERFLDKYLINTVDLYLKKIGFRFVTFDLGGYAMGSVSGKPTVNMASQYRE